MPSIDWNKSLWDGSFNWDKEGEQWSSAWGGSEGQWFGSLYPRIHRFLPSKSVLEIAPGFGRWTKFILGMCDSYTGVDLSEKCIRHCQSIFSKVSFIKNDGASLEQVEDSSIEFCFSFDSLVHAELEVFESYIPQILNKLVPQGVAFLHHSNLLDCGESSDYRHNRARSVSSRKISEMITRYGGVIFIQENINWGRSPDLIDGLTLFGRSPRQGQSITSPISNNRFMTEAAIIKDVIARYSI